MQRGGVKVMNPAPRATPPTRTYRTSRPQTVHLAGHADARRRGRTCSRRGTLLDTRARTHACSLSRPVPSAYLTLTHCPLKPPCPLPMCGSRLGWMDECEDVQCRTPMPAEPSRGTKPPCRHCSRRLLPPTPPGAAERGIADTPERCPTSSVPAA
jgi:hypothetical protein